VEHHSLKADENPRSVGRRPVIRREQRGKVEQLQVQVDEVLSAIPFGRKELRVVRGGLRAPGLHQPELGDESPDVIVANAAVTVWVNREEPHGH